MSLKHRTGERLTCACCHKYITESSTQLQYLGQWLCCDCAGYRPEPDAVAAHHAEVQRRAQCAWVRCQTRMWAGYLVSVCRLKDVGTGLAAARAAVEWPSGAVATAVTRYGWALWRESTPEDNAAKLRDAVARAGAWSDSGLWTPQPAAGR